MQHWNKDKALRQDNPSKITRMQPARRTVEELLASRAQIALFLDIDGTLLDVALTPAAVHVPPDLAGLLKAVSVRLSGALAIVTGRPISEADRLLKPLKLTAAGVHGAELRTSASGDIVTQTNLFSLELAADIKAAAKALPGIVMEDKGTGISLHYRLVPELHEPLLLAVDALERKYPGEFKACEGRKVLEILPIGFSKGRALQQLAALPNFSNRVPVMIGDDIADLDAFHVAEEMGGYGLKVAGENFSEAESSFGGPDDVLNWLRSLDAYFERSASEARAGS
jgi:trehalose 6-phosphate phosphatase